MSILSLIGISTAYAAAPAQPSTQEGLLSVLPMLIAFVAIFYFLLIRPQNKRTKEHRELLSHLSKGDEVVTSGGILGKVTKIEEQFIVLTIAEGVSITVQKQAVAQVMPKGTLKTKE